MSDRTLTAGPAGPAVWSREGLWVPVCIAPPRGALRLLLLGGWLWGAWLHWIECPGVAGDGRTLPCLADRSKCPECQAGRRRRWAGWLSAWWPDHARHAMAQLSLDAARLTPLLRGADAGPLRGWEIALRRSGGCKNAPVAVDLAPRGAVLPDSLAPYDVQAALSRVWDRETGWARGNLAWTHGVPINE